MSSASDPTPLVWVTGDKTVDFALETTGRYVARSADERLHVPVKLLWHKGGIFLLKAMIEASLDSNSGNIVHCAEEPSEGDLIAYGGGFNSSFAVLRDYPVGTYERSRMREREITDKEYPETVYRFERYLGFRSRPVEEQTRGGARFTEPLSDYPKVIVVDDADLGFRANSDHWRGIIPEKSRKPETAPWLLLKMSFNIATGNFWEEIESRLASEDSDWLKDRLVVQTSVARLRDLDAEISKNLSWERSVYDALTEIDSNKKLQCLRACPWLIVSFGPSGALLINRSGKGLKWRLVYNRGLMEGEWAATHKNGMMFGYGSALCACLARELAQKAEPDMAAAVRTGLGAMQRLYDEGFITNGAELYTPSRIFKGSDRLSDQLSMTNRRKNYNRVSCPPLLGNTKTDLKLHEGKLLRIAREGVSALRETLPRVPVAKFGNLVTVDREEIEDLHAIYNLIDNYCGDGTVSLGSKPLAIAIFGEPGAGKGYAIEQLTSQWREQVINPVNFNLSQFSSPSEIVGALHQVRDIALEGKVPLVLWDEFDSPLSSSGGKFGWLRYFLAPIQDGRFQQADKTHLIGPSIFAFAGGTAPSFQEFSRRAKKAEAKGEDLKATDFLSRIRGYINIADVSAPNDRSPKPLLMLRRALILNSLFGKHSVAKRKGEGYVVDDGILHAFLAIPRFEHGVRSMEAIVQMSRRRPGQPFDRSSLASQDQLDLHVPGKAFLDIIRAHQNLSQRV
ncbi:hypothetical protein [Streptomyces platensis]|uniref:hypothetical protein n=1 Tax=Streptomyces platensis TaxID=58346 RepID=UPI002E257F61